jgi:hypothetical protein
MKKLLSTKILDKHYKIGPFFYKEFVFVFAGSTILLNMMITINLFIKFSKIYVFLGPLIFITGAGLWRYFSKEKGNPWYLQELVSYYLFQPTHLNAYKTGKKVDINKN